MKNLPVYLIILTFLLSACEKPDPKIVEPIEPSDSGKLEMIWKIPLTEDLRPSTSITPLVASGKVVFSAIRSNSLTLIGLNTVDGTLKWQWNDFVGNISLYGANFTHLYQDQLVYNYWSETGVLNANTGTSLWTYKDPKNNGDPRITLIDDYIFHTRSSEGLRNETTTIVRSKIGVPQWEDVFTLHRDSLDGYAPSIEGPSLWIAPNGDSVFVFQNRSWNFDTSDGQIDFYAYNLATKKVQFILEDIEPSGNSNVFPPLVDGDRCYFMGFRQFYCIDLVEQKIIWTKQFLGSFHHIQLSNCIVEGDRVFVKTDDEFLFCYDKYTGSVIWELLGAGDTDSYMEYFDGVLYYTADGDGKLYAVNADNGKIIWKEDSPNEDKVPASFNGGVAVDPVNRLIFVADRYYAMAFKLPEL